MASLCSIHCSWLLRVLPVADSFSNEEMRTASRICVHQSTREAINTSLWRRKTKTASVATSPVVLRWLCDSPRTGCAWRITPLYMWREQAIIEWSWLESSADINLWTIEHDDWRTRRVIMACLYCCLLPRCEALRTCCSGFPIATLASTKRNGWPFTT